MKLLVDACLTPEANGIGWEYGVDVAHVNHRGLRQAGDTQIWQYANSDGRAIVTVNEDDFISRAKSRGAHCGVFIVQDGLLREEQITTIQRICRFIADEDAACRSMNDRLFRIDEHGTIVEAKG